MFGEPVLVGGSEAFDIGPGISPGQGGGEGDEHHLAEVVVQPPVESGVGNFFKMFVNDGGDGREHD